MTRINMTELRKRLPYFLDCVARGESVEITRFDQVVARLTPAVDPAEAARARLIAMREVAVLHDVESPIDVQWEANS